MSVAIVTGAAGLVGSEAVRFLVTKGFDVIGIENNMRSVFFGNAAGTSSQMADLCDIPTFSHAFVDVRSPHDVNDIFRAHGKAISLVIHTAAQPSHDWAATDPMTDFSINAVGTLNLLEATRKHCPDAVFIHCSTNKVYGDAPNRLPFIEKATRWEIDPGHVYAGGIDETMGIDLCLHSLFGVSKASADLLVQEYGRYFGMRTGCFRGGCLTGPAHAGARQHGFLAYLIQCAVTGTEYQIVGYGGKQVRDNIHASDLITAFWSFFEAPRPGEVYNIGGGRAASCSILEAIHIAEELARRGMVTSYVDTPRIGDHQWWITDMTKFRAHYPDWRPIRDLRYTMGEIHTAAHARHRSKKYEGLVQQSALVDWRGR